MIFTGDESNSSDSDDDSGQEDCESVDQNSPSFQGVQANSGHAWNSAACIVPPEEKPMLETEHETPAFADSEDELEMSENEVEVCTDGGEESLEEDDDDEEEGEEEEEEETTNTTLKEQTAINMEEEFGKYTCYRLDYIQTSF